MAIKTGIGFKDMDVVLYGNLPTYFSEFVFKTTHGKTNRKGRGEKVVLRDRTGKDMECTVTLGIEEMFQIEAAVITKYGVGYDPTDAAPIDVPVIYDNGDFASLAVIYDFEWMEWAGGTKQGDEGTQKTLACICSRIEYGLPA